MIHIGSNFLLCYVQVSKSFIFKSLQQDINKALIRCPLGVILSLKNSKKYISKFTKIIVISEDESKKKVLIIKKYFFVLQQFILSHKDLI